MDRGAWWATVHWVAELDTTEATEHVRIKSQLFGWGVSGVSDHQVGVLTDNAIDAQQWSEDGVQQPWEAANTLGWKIKERTFTKAHES